MEPRIVFDPLGEGEQIFCCESHLEAYLAEVLRVSLKVGEDGHLHPVPVQ